MSDIEIIYPDPDCSFLLQIILGLSIKLGQWIIGKENIAKPAGNKCLVIYISCIEWRVDIICLRKKYKVLKAHSQCYNFKDFLKTKTPTKS